MTKTNNKMIGFIGNTPNAYYCVENLGSRLLKKEYIELSEGGT